MADNLGATPRPWAVNPVRAQIDAFDTGVPVPVCQMLWPTDERTEAETEANAALIVKAVNAYDDMLAALRGVLQVYGLQAARDRADPEMLQGWRKLQAELQVLIAKHATPHQD